ncbi:SDR family oxidoreductase [Microbacterium sp. YJN-G]|uniref:SDR family oxidoreductase n=1 Tax=Microbacterium sp. YJN-G TaxID=2763257 RepID=UPI001877AA15|nr:SDR family oxidoreductase [Microbacterium sp. YJN-G]
MTTLSHRWVIGRGLLGEAVARARSDVPFHRRIDWSEALRSLADLSAATTEFTRRAGPLEIYWCAGKGVTSTTEQALKEEVSVFEQFLEQLAMCSPEVRSRLVLFVASSVGGVYAGCTDAPFDETTHPVPASPYGHAKLAIERVASERGKQGGWRTVIGRLTNLYGPGQDLTKGQGLISTLANSAITQQPATIYVSLDTLRDYIFEDDAASIISACVARMHERAAGATVVKIVGSGRAVSVGAVVAEMTRLHRRRGFSLLGQGPSAGQALDLRVASQVWTDLDALAGTTLPEGLGRVLRARLQTLTTS